jgi:hypothetical protein
MGVQQLPQVVFHMCPVKRFILLSKRFPRISELRWTRLNDCHHCRVKFIIKRGRGEMKNNATLQNYFSCERNTSNVWTRLPDENSTFSLELTKSRERTYYSIFLGFRSHRGRERSALCIVHCASQTAYTPWLITRRNARKLLLSSPSLVIEPLYGFSQVHHAS